MKKERTKTAKSSRKKLRPPRVGDPVLYDPVGNVRAGGFGVVAPGVLVAVNGSRAKMWSHNPYIGHTVDDVAFEHLMLDRHGYFKLPKDELACIQAALKPGPIGSWFFNKKRARFRKKHLVAVGEINLELDRLMCEYNFGPDIDALVARHPEVFATYKSDLREHYKAILKTQLRFMMELEGLERG